MALLTGFSWLCRIASVSAAFRLASTATGWSNSDLPERVGVGPLAAGPVEDDSLVAATLPQLGGLSTAGLLHG
jgi:hypothetical protein